MKKVQNKKEKQEKPKKASKTKQNKEKRKIFQRLGEILKKRWLVNGSKTILLVCIIIAIYIGINILLENVVLPEIDCTENKIYSLSQESKDKLKNLDKDVKFTLINYSEGNNTVLKFVENI